MFTVGQKVVCIAAPWAVVATPPWTCPILDSVYVVRNIFPWPNGRGASCRLAEIRNAPIEGFEPAFSIEFFRPLAAPKTDISILTKLLTPSPRERIDA